MLFSLLRVLDGEPGHFRRTQTASEEDSYHGVVTHATQIGAIEHGQKSFSCSAVNQFPMRMPRFFTPFTRRIPAGCHVVSLQQRTAS